MAIHPFTFYDKIGEFSEKHLYFIPKGGYNATGEGLETHPAQYP
jgi:hypothetical protein